jgi:hypothetical protein
VCSFRLSLVGLFALALLGALLSEKNVENRRAGKGLQGLPISTFVLFHDKEEKHDFGDGYGGEKTQNSGKKAALVELANWCGKMRMPAFRYRNDSL